MTMDKSTVLVMLYVVPLVFNLVYNITTEWKSLHTVRDFLFPLDGEDNISIWFPVLNAVYMIIFIISIVVDGIERFLDLKIKK